MHSCLKQLKVLILICTMSFALFSCEDDAIIAPKGQTAAGSYGRMSFPDDTTNIPVMTNVQNPEIF